MTPIRKMHEPANGIKYFEHNPVGSVRIFACNVIAYIDEVGERIWVERVAAAYAAPLRSAWVFAFRREKASSPSIGFTPPLFRSS